VIHTWMMENKQFEYNWLQLDRREEWRSLLEDRKDMDERYEV
jgi:hypothetical protein